MWKSMVSVEEFPPSRAVALAVKIVERAAGMVRLSMEVW